MFVLTILQFLALLMLLTVAVLTDLRERRIPNKVTVPGLLAGLVIGAVLEGGFPQVALGGASLALLVSFPLVALGGLGAGDAKLLTAVGAFVGPGGLLPAVRGGLFHLCRLGPGLGRRPLCRRPLEEHGPGDGDRPASLEAVDRGGRLFDLIEELESGLDLLPVEIVPRARPPSGQGGVETVTAVVVEADLVRPNGESL